MASATLSGTDVTAASRRGCSTGHREAGQGARLQGHCQCHCLNKIDDLAKNYKNLGQVNTYFSVETVKQNIHDQQSSGRCWLFSGLNVLTEPALPNSTTTPCVGSAVVPLLWRPVGENNLIFGRHRLCRSPWTTRGCSSSRNPIGDGLLRRGRPGRQEYGLVPMSVMPDLLEQWPPRRCRR